jgi:hypothetical protein
MRDEGTCAVNVPNAPCARCGKTVEDGRLLHQPCFEESERESHDELMRALASDPRIDMPGRNVAVKGLTP